MNNTFKIGAVSYLNTKPLLFGFDKNKWNIVEHYPSKLAEMLLNNEIDIGLIPVAIIPQLKEHYIISNYCIGAVNTVASVGLFCNVAIENVDTILLDFESKTSVALIKILMKHYWKKDVIFKQATTNFIDKINGNTAAVIIGDKALQHLNKTNFYYDLADAWINFTNLPFVFAAWVSNKKLPKNFIDEFNAATSFGVNNIDAVLQQVECNYYDAKKYFTENISYNFDEKKQQGLQLFLNYLKQDEIV